LVPFSCRVAQIKSLTCRHRPLKVKDDHLLRLGVDSISGYVPRCNIARTVVLVSAGWVCEPQVSDFLEWPRSSARPGIARRAGKTRGAGRIPGGLTAFRIIVHPHYVVPLDRGKSHKLLKKWRQKFFCNRSIFRLTQCPA